MRIHHLEFSQFLKRDSGTWNIYERIAPKKDYTKSIKSLKSNAIVLQISNTILFQKTYSGKGKFRRSFHDFRNDDNPELVRETEQRSTEIGKEVWVKFKILEIQRPRRPFVKQRHLTDQHHCNVKREEISFSQKKILNKSMQNPEVSFIVIYSNLHIVMKSLTHFEFLWDIVLSLYTLGWSTVNIHFTVKSYKWTVNIFIFIPFYEFVTYPLIQI